MTGDRMKEALPLTSTAVVVPCDGFEQDQRESRESRERQASGKGLQQRRGGYRLFFRRRATVRAPPVTITPVTSPTHPFFSFL
ncbi:hypothetical protein HanRHA438_Chr14g0634751 [Helianthus annuus]|uniref:Uncharacterized protein n=1 Tax=Helianthus annuus TaxID=4232 RepID=A0A251SE55_HELAN|nr:hypothetical protein HanXRQr2_Chr14g0624671 [Helianthus annuus]KAJ0463011.1 hypothetical protein HanHA300_Chr14g0510451 [Helianthus annuus]KAJ0484374.1 hypothetical protein HanHA89_Chr14g0543411 [Helianthus annuus]KAJ0654927.1 hypothetical protein HanLR1_Chr14g0512681 [Helianthus annuus]KAJ0804014.1 hypothetical protein HanOQP8_Chr00c237g0796891 [Helianthus annuus]